MKYAWIENNQIRDIAWTDPNKIYHPDVAKFYDTQVPDDAQNGDGWENGQLIKPEPPAPPAPAARTWTIENVRSQLSLSEKVKWDNDATPEIKTAKVELVVPQKEAAMTELLTMLVSSNSISQESATKVME